MLNFRTIAILYALFATVAVLLLATVMPPFQNADELNHVFRADQISHFGLLAQDLPNGKQGGWVDAGLLPARAPFDGIPFHPTAKVARAMYAPQVWGGLVPVPFSNTAIYPPVFYIPAAAALATARVLHLSVLHGIVLARIATGLTSIAVSSVAVALADAASIWLFAVLLLPMSLALTAAVSQDSLLLATSALASALCLRLWRNPAQCGWLAPALALALVGTARPPYAAMALALLGARISLRSRLAALAVAWLPVLAWSIVTAPHVVMPIFSAGAVDPAAQARLLMHAPWRVFTLLAATWQAYSGFVLNSFIGQLGWLDVTLPQPYHRAAWLVLALAAWSAFGGSLPRVSWLALAGVASACLGVALIQYFVWTVPGSRLIEGWVGRYFLPPALMLAAAFFQTRPGLAVLAAKRAVVLFPIITIPAVLHAIVLRYYI